MRLVIKPIDFVGGGRQAGLENITVAEINKRLGFKPNVEDDPDKVVNSWAFTINGKECSVWDYKGSQHHNSFSCNGDETLMRAVFGLHYRKDRW